MPARFRKKVRRLRGSKTHGWGSKKKHRGGGSKGGKGKSGWMKHKKSFMIKNEPDHFGRVGFKIPPPIYRRRLELKIINLKDIDKMARKSGKKEIELLGYKVLSEGKLTNVLIIKAKTFSEKAKQKIQESGGKFIEG